MFRKFALLGLLAVLSMPLESFGFSYTTDFQNGFYWQGFPITMTRFVNDAADQALLRTITEDAEDAWENYVGTDVWNYNEDVLVSQAYFGSYIRWSENFGAETGFDPGRTLAVTIRYTQGTFMTRTEIILNGNYPGMKQNANNILWKTLLHELGHTIGLDHSSQWAIMQATPSSLTTLTADDQNGINAAVNQHLQWQSEGFVSPLAGQTEEEKSTFLGCGSIGTPPASGGPGNGMNFLVSLLLGMVLLSVSRLKDRLHLSVINS